MAHSMDNKVYSDFTGSDCLQVRESPRIGDMRRLKEESYLQLTADYTASGEPFSPCQPMCS